MKNLFLICFLVLIYSSCTDQSASEQTDEQTDNATTTNTSILKAIEADTYQQMKKKSLASTPIDRLCNESKGYKKHEWQGLNECDWAVEKYNIEKHQGLVERVDNTLNLSLTDKTLALTHQAGKGQHYQFKGYSKKTGIFYLNASTEKGCPEHWLIDQKSGKITILKGAPVFNATEDAFVLSTSSQRKKGCKNELEYWQFENGVFKQTKSLQPQQAVYDIVFSAPNSWLATTKNPTTSNMDFVKIAWD